MGHAGNFSFSLVLYINAKFLLLFIKVLLITLDSLITSSLNIKLSFLIVMSFTCKLITYFSFLLILPFVYKIHAKYKFKVSKFT